MATATRSIFITWLEVQRDFKDWRYVGGGVYDPIFDERVVTKRCRYSSAVTDEMMTRAKEYAATIEDKMAVKVEILND